MIKHLRNTQGNHGHVRGQDLCKRTVAGCLVLWKACSVAPFGKVREVHHQLSLFSISGIFVRKKNPATNPIRTRSVWPNISAIFFTFPTGGIGTGCGSFITAGSVQLTVGDKEFVESDLGLLNTEIVSGRALLGSALFLDKCCWLLFVVVALL